MKKNYFKKACAAAWAVAVQFLLASPVYAGAISTPGDLKNILCITVFGWMFVFLIVLSSIMALIGGYFYVTSGGDPEKVSRATKTLMYSVIGIVVAFAARAIPQLVGNLLGQTFVGC